METNKKNAELENGLEIWSLVISNLKEQDINAQVMDDRKMKILTSNIKNRGALESLPFVYKEGEKFSIISGHYRVKAASGAGMKTVYAIVETNPLTKSQIISKQIAHNELVGEHDSEILGQLVKQMQEVDDLIASGLPEKYLDGLKEKSPVLNFPQLAFDWRMVTLQFLPDQVKDFELLAKAIDKKSELIGVAPLPLFNDFVAAMRKFGLNNNIKSLGTTIAFLTKIALNELEKWQDLRSITQSSTSRGLQD